MKTYSVYYGIEDIEHRGWDNYDYYKEWVYLGLYNGNSPSDAVVAAMRETGRCYGAFKIVLFHSTLSDHKEEKVNIYNIDGKSFAEMEVEQYKIIVNEGKAHCVKCSKETVYRVRQERMRGKVDEKEYDYIGLEAKCSECNCAICISEIESWNKAALKESSIKIKADIEAKEKEESSFLGSLRKKQ